MNQRHHAATVISCIHLCDCYRLVTEAVKPEPESPQAPRQSSISGIDKSLFSDSVSAGENFYLYANQKWLETTEIPADKSNYGIFTLLDDMTREQVRELIEQAGSAEGEPGSAAQKVGDLYKSVLNIQARNESRHQAAARIIAAD